MKDTIKILDTFESLLSVIYGRNLVVGGMAALRIHGLITRPINDLDLVIYNPTSDQLKTIETLKSFEFHETDKDKVQDDYDQVDGAPRRSFKYKLGEYIIDLLIEHDNTPECLLQFTNGSRAFYVQSVETIIDAKRKYGRKKDLRDLIELQRNFGL